MPNHQIFNERPESQDRALKELQAMGYQYIPRVEAEQKRGHLSHVLFPDVMRKFCHLNPLCTGESRHPSLMRPLAKPFEIWMLRWNAALCSPARQFMTA